MRIQRQADGWWIVDVPCDASGRLRLYHLWPYATKADAADDKRGLERFFRDQPVSEMPARLFLQSGPPESTTVRHWADPVDGVPPSAVASGKTHPLLAGPEDAARDGSGVTGGKSIAIGNPGIPEARR